MRYAATGRVNGISIDMETNKPMLSLLVDDRSTEAFHDLLTCPKLDITIRSHKEKRSLDANAYYWTLCGKLAKVLSISNAAVHNIMLRKYGVYERINGSLVSIPLPDTDDVVNDVLEKTEYHLLPSSKVTTMKGGERYRIYIMLRGSHTYNTEEMSRLIGGLIQDCRDAGIPDYEIMTPFEKQKLKEQYGIGDNDEVKEN